MEIDEIEAALAKERALADDAREKEIQGILFFETTDYFKKD
jgi:hypothetical protein